MARAADNEGAGAALREGFDEFQEGKSPTGVDAGGAGHFVNHIAGVENVGEAVEEIFAQGEERAGQGGVEDVEEFGRVGAEVGAPAAGGVGAGGFAEEEAEFFGRVLLREAAGARGFDAVGAAVDEERDGGEGQGRRVISD